MFAVQEPEIWSTFGTVSPSSWPKVWTTEAEIDLQSRLARLPFYAPVSGLGAAGFGDVMSDLQAILQKAPALLQKGVQIIDKAGPHLDTILKVVEDPAFPQLISRIKTLQAIEAQKAVKTPPAPGTATPTSAPGVGLKRVLPIWDVVIFYEKNRAAFWLIAGGSVLVLTGIGFGIGYSVGRRRARRQATTATVGRHYRRR